MRCWPTTAEIVPPGGRSPRPWLAAAVCLVLALLAGCGGPERTRRESEPRRPALALPTMRYAIQAGAFKNIDNAVRLTERLRTRRLAAYHFVDESGFYKVRIGNFAAREEAAETAERLKSERIIEEYFIVAPGDYAVARVEEGAEGPFRRELVRTAERFVGVPYRWGGESTVAGFDCSGLTMAVYQLNGLNLPRTSGDQWAAGRPVELREIAEGDLVFFATSGGGKVSHVGIFIGGDRFLHAPGQGSRIQVASLASDYFRTRYLGARSYL